MLRGLRNAALVFIACLAPLAFAAQDREVSIGLQAAITSIDPHYHNLSPNNSLQLHIYEPLINREPGGKDSPSGVRPVDRGRGYRKRWHEEQQRRLPRQPGLSGAFELRRRVRGRRLPL